jgi:hypothetical protein
MKYSVILKCSLIVTALLCLMLSNLAFAQGNNANDTEASVAGDNVYLDQEAYRTGLDAYVYLYHW